VKIPLNTYVFSIAQAVKDKHVNTMYKIFS